MFLMNRIKNEYVNGSNVGRCLYIATNEKSNLSPNFKAFAIRYTFAMQQSKHTENLDRADYGRLTIFTKVTVCLTWNIYLFFSTIFFVFFLFFFIIFINFIFCRKENKQIHFCYQHQHLSDLTWTCFDERWVAHLSEKSEKVFIFISLCGPFWSYNNNSEWEESIRFSHYEFTPRNRFSFDSLDLRFSIISVSSLNSWMKSCCYHIYFG